MEQMPPTDSDAALAALPQKRSLYMLIALVKMGPIAVTDDASSNLARGANRDVHSKIVYRDVRF
ncbi:hypothetical protein AJ87_45670 [Rhizobium yanglingense]|nr:hypothetical protein AJ87_45670 [Rhizobium yanglingense]